MAGIFDKIRNFFSGVGGNEAGTPTSSAIYKMVSIPLPFSDEILVAILSFLPAEDLLERCVWVTEFKPLIDCHSLWIMKCEREGKPLPPTKPEPIPEHFYKCIYMVPYHKNLILNPCGEDGTNHWNVLKRHGWQTCKWYIEKPPIGIVVKPEIVIECCFVTSDTFVSKEQMVQLLPNVYNYAEIMDDLRPPIEISEWLGVSYESTCLYLLKVTLENYDGGIIDKFKINSWESSSKSGQWRRFSHVFKNYPKGVRIVRFQHAGMAKGFYGGPFGLKMAHSCVSFVPNV